MRAALADLAGAVDGGQRWLAMSDELERVMLEEKGLRPNLDFPTGRRTS